MRKEIIIVISLLSLLHLTGCSFNPFISHHHETGSPVGVIAGSAIGAGSVGLLGASKTTMVLAGIGGGAIGYYVTTLRFASGGIIQRGGQVYQVGEFIGIYIPTDNLFEPNTAQFLPQANAVLDSAFAVLKRKPTNHILISGNTSGFARATWERKLSQERAKQIAFYLWQAGIEDTPVLGNAKTRLNYVGYGDYLPIASNLTNDGIRANSRIQITSYPTDLTPNLCNSFYRVGAFKDEGENGGSACFK